MWRILIPKQEILDYTIRAVGGEMDKVIEQSSRRGRCHWVVAASDPSSCLRTARDGRQAPIRAGKGAGGNREAKALA